MGTWGPGNLENDYVLDELADRTTRLVEAIMERASRPTSREYDEYDHTTLFGEFELLFAMDKHGLASGGDYPPVNVVDALKWDFVAAWEAYFRDDADPAYPKKRRAVILRTFNRFKRICAAHLRTFNRFKRICAAHE